MKAQVVLTEEDKNSTYDSLLEYFERRISETEMMGSGWYLKSIDYIRLKTVKYTPIRGGCRRALRNGVPGILKGRRIVVNIDNDDEKCFKWAVTRFGNPEKNKHGGRVTELLREQSKQFNWDGVEFLAGKKDLEKFEKYSKDYAIFCYLVVDGEISIFYRSDCCFNKNKKNNSFNVARKTFHACY